MACVRIADKNRIITNEVEIYEFLISYGIEYQRWPIEGRVIGGATNDEILKAYASEIQLFKKRGNFIAVDVVNVGPQTPGLEAMLNKFNKEHTHSEDEIRFIVSGRGLFHIHSRWGVVFSIQVESGDLINLPAETQHWFDLCEEKTICAIRFFKNKDGWDPYYLAHPVHEKYPAVYC